MSRVRGGHWLAAVLAALLFTTALAAAPTEADQVIVPGSASKAPAPAPGATGTGTLTLVAVVLLGTAGGWLVWRGRGRGPASFGRGVRNLTIEETRSLGGRQYLVVAAYQDRKFLLGVCPGRIDLLAPLTPSAAELTREAPKS